MSYKTTVLGPRVSIKTGNDGGTLDPGTGGFDVEAPLILSGANVQTTKAAASTLKSGQLSIISLSVSSAVIAFTSGNTTYTFIADAAE
jgi:hypothetical protein